MLRLTFLAAIAALACMAADSERRVRFAHTTDARVMDEVAAILKAVAGVEQIVVNKEAREIVFRAGDEKSKAAEWIHQQLDRPAAEQKARSAEFIVSAAGGQDTVRMLFSPRPESPQTLRELATVLRSTVEIRDVFICNAFGAIVMRGSAKQGEAAEWLFGRLRPSGTEPSPAEFQLDRREGLVRVVDLKQAAGPVEAQELATLLRMTADLRWVFTVASSKAIVIRGVPEKLAAAQWLIARVEDEAAAEPRRHVYTLAADELNRVQPQLDLRAYALPAAYDPERVRQLAVKLRGEARLHRIFAHSGARLIAARGRADQMAAADRIFASATR